MAPATVGNKGTPARTATPAKDGGPAPGLSNPGNRKPGDVDKGVHAEPDTPQPPATSPRNPKENNSAAPKSGGGAGGGNPDKRTGEGTAGAESAANKGGALSNEHGPGATGSKAGEDVQANRRTVSTIKQPGERDRETQESRNNTASRQCHAQAARRSHSDARPKPGHFQRQAGRPTARPAVIGSAGRQRRDEQRSPTLRQPTEAGPNAPDLSFANKQVDLALEHLKDQKDKPKSELLDRLGWTKEEAQKFIDNLQKLKDSAQRPGARARRARRPTTSF